MNDSGELRFAQTTLSYIGPYGPVWVIAVDDVHAVAEFITAGGPVADDYFVVFLASTGQQHVASFHADGCEAALAGLGAALGTQLVGGLADQTSWASRGIWPKVIADRPFFDLRPVGPRTWGAHVRRWLGRQDLERVVRPEVVAAIRMAPERGAI